jgi:hypothetical protein
MSPANISLPNDYQEAPKILYVGGVGRSGSTLVGRVLGEGSRSICIGETRYLWSRGIRHNVECGCGRPFLSCDFWSEVGEHAFGGWDQVDAERLIELDAATNRLRALPLFWLPSLRQEFTTLIDEYASYLARVYIALAHVSRAEIIVETSKEPNFAWLLTRIPENQVYLVHLVRDGRAVAYSWTRTQRMPSPIGDQEYMPCFNPRHVAARWLFSNAAFHALGHRTPSVLINYEDFVVNPAPALRKISDLTGEEFELDDTKLSGRTVRLGEHHIFSGNPMRTDTGWLEMRLDDEWQHALSRTHLLEVTTMTWPLLCLYGYRLKPEPTAVM